MIGTAAAPGIMVHTLQDLFAGIASRPAHSYQLSLSYLEVYNEQIRDLLSPLPTSTPLSIREERDGSMSIAGLTSHTPTSADDVFRILERGNTRRTQSATDANSQSSRSHAVLQVGLRMKDRDGDRQGSRIRLAKLSLIDLAGSERAAVSKNRGQTLKEGANINRSLLALGNCSVDSSSLHLPWRVIPSAPSPVLTVCGCVCACRHQPAGCALQPAGLARVNAADVAGQARSCAGGHPPFHPSAREGEPAPDLAGG